MKEPWPSFSPLFVGSMGETFSFAVALEVVLDAFSPLFVGSMGETLKTSPPG